MFSTAMHRKYPVLEGCVGFIDGTVIGIERRNMNDDQNAAYNADIRKHALNYQTITTPDDLIMHAHGPMEDFGHDWAQ